MEHVEHTTQQEPQTEAQSGKEGAVKVATAAPEPAGLSGRDREHYERFLAGMREVAERWNLAYRRDAVAGLIEALDARGNVEGLWIDHKYRADFLHPVAVVSEPSSQAARAAMETLLEEADVTFGKVKALQAMEGDVRGILDRLSPTARAAMGIVVSLMWMEGLSLGIKFGMQIVDELGSDEQIGQAIDQAGADSDAAILRKAFDLIHEIEQAERH